MALSAVRKGPGAYPGVFLQGLNSPRAPRIFSPRHHHFVHLAGIDLYGVARAELRFRFVSDRKGIWSQIVSCISGHVNDAIVSLGSFV